EVGEMSYTQSLPATQNYGIEVLNAPAQFLYETYALPVLEQSWENLAVTLISTGFRQPANNSNGEPLQVWALLPDGTMQALPQFVLTEDFTSNSEIRVFPNPASETIRVKTADIGQGIVTVRIIDLFGHVIQERKCTTHQGNIDERFETAFLPSGIYTIHLLSETFALSSPLVIQH
ncbi:MAG: T9SS type A sorting domain-containing protein, partial [Flavobacteriales bacterium]